MAQQYVVSSTLQNHRRKLRLEGFTYNLDLLCQQLDHLPPDHPDRPGLLLKIERQNIEDQAED